jgi:ABC-type nickel/cobalt efflux system permease component RcnA
MKTTKNEGMISKRVVLESVMLLLSILVISNTIDLAFNSSKASLFLYSLTGLMFFSLFFLYRMNKGYSKNKNLQTLNPEKKINHYRDHYHYYHKVVKKTA